MSKNRMWRAWLAAAALAAGSATGVWAAELSPDYMGETFDEAPVISGSVRVVAKDCTVNGKLTVTGDSDLYMYGGSLNGGLHVDSGSNMVGYDVDVTSNINVEEKWVESPSYEYKSNGYVGLINSTINADTIRAQGGWYGNDGTYWYSGVEAVGSTITVKNILAEDSKRKDDVGGIVAFGLGTTAAADRVAAGAHSAVAVGDFTFTDRLDEIEEYLPEDYVAGTGTSTLTIQNAELAGAKKGYRLGTEVFEAMRQGMLGGTLAAAKNGQIVLKDGAVTGNGTLLAMGGKIQSENMTIHGKNIVAVDPESWGDAATGMTSGTSSITLSQSQTTSDIFGAAGKTSAVTVDGGTLRANDVYVLNGASMKFTGGAALSAKWIRIGYVPEFGSFSSYADTDGHDTLTITDGAAYTVNAGDTFAIGDSGVVNIDAGGLLTVKTDGTLNAIGAPVNVFNSGKLVLEADSITETVARENGLVASVIYAEDGADVAIDSKAKLFVTNAKADGTVYDFSEVVMVEGAGDAAFQDIYGSTILTKLDENGKTFTTSDIATALPEAFASHAMTGALLDGQGAAADFVNKVLGKDAGTLTLSERASHLNQLSALTSLGGVAHGTYGFTDTVSALVEDRAGKQDGIWASYIREDKTVDGFRAGSESADYDLKYNGFILGGDFADNGHSRTGAAFAYADGDVSSNGGRVSTKNDAKYYSGSVYHVITSGDMTYKADIGYTWSDNDLTQYNLGTKVTGSADASALHIGLRAEKEIAAGSSVWTPYAGLRYILLDADDYTDSLGFQHKSDKAGIWNLPVGVTFTHKVESGSWSYTPVVELGYVFAFGDKKIDESLGYGGSWDSFDSDTAESRFVGKVGFAAKKDQMSYELHYGYEKGSDVQSNQWGVQVSYSF